MMSSPPSYLAGDVVWRQAWWAPFASVAAIYGLQFISTWSLLDSCAQRGLAARRALLLVTLYFVADVVCNPGYTFGSKLRDTGLGSLSWILLSSTLVVGISYDVPQTLICSKGTTRVPHWCVPDWEAEEKENAVQHTNGKPRTTPSFSLAWWQRTPLPRRPGWARQANVIPRHWRLLPRPTRWIDQAIWSVDVMMLRQYGTSQLFAQEMRALDWSKMALEQAGDAQREARKALLSSPTPNPTLQPFGYTEVPLRHAFIDAAMVAWAIRYLTFAHVPAHQYADFYTLPLKQQLLITFAFGITLSMPTTILEHITMPVQQTWPFNRPGTAVIPRFRDVRRSQSITELWSWRWHATYKRDFVSLARLLPPYSSTSTSPLHATLLMLKVFFWSGVMHSMVIARATIAPPTSWRDLHAIRQIFFLPACMAFFMAQAVLVLVEQSFGLWWRRRRACKQQQQQQRCDDDNDKPQPRPQQPLSPSQRAILYVAQNAWVWIALLATGHLLAAETVAANLLVQKEIVTMQFTSMGSDYYGFFRRHLAGPNQA